MQYVIATKPGRLTRKYSNNVQKFARVSPSGRFTFVTDVNQATVFNAASELLRAVGLRARALRRGRITSELTIAEVEQPVGARVTRILNGGR